MSSTYSTAIATYFDLLLSNARAYVIERRSCNARYRCLCVQSPGQGRTASEAVEGGEAFKHDLFRQKSETRLKDSFTCDS